MLLYGTNAHDGKNMHQRCHIPKSDLVHACPSSATAKAKPEPCPHPHPKCNVGQVDMFPSTSRQSELEVARVRVRVRGRVKEMPIFLFSYAESRTASQAWPGDWEVGVSARVTGGSSIR